MIKEKFVYLSGKLMNMTPDIALCCRLPLATEQTLATLYSLIIIIGVLTNTALLLAFCTNKVLLQFL